MLIQTKEVSMRPEDVKRVFQNNADDLVEWISKGTTSFIVVILWNVCSVSPSSASLADVLFGSSHQVCRSQKCCSTFF